MSTWSKTRKKTSDPNDLIKTLVIYIYIFFLLQKKAFTIYTVLIVYYTVHTENDVYGAPHSDKNPAQTGSSYQAVCLFISLHHRAVRRHWELRFHWRTVGSVLSHWQRWHRTIWQMTVKTTVLASLTHNTFHWKPDTIQNSSLEIT